MRTLVCLALVLVSPALAQQDDELLRHWDYDKSAPLHLKQAGVQARDGVTIYDVSFSSPVGDRSAAVDRLADGAKAAERLRLPRLAAAIDNERIRLGIEIEPPVAARLRAARTIPHDDGIAVNAAAPSNPVATPGAGTLDLAKTDTEDIELITETAFRLCTGDPKTMTGRIARTQSFLAEVGWSKAAR